MDIIKPGDPEPKADQAPEKAPETSIDLDSKTKVMTISIFLGNGPVNAYGTLQLAMEYCSRYFTTLEIANRKLMQENQSANSAKIKAEKDQIDGALAKIGIVLPGVKK